MNNKDVSYLKQLTSNYINNSAYSNKNIYQCEPVFLKFIPSRFAVSIIKRMSMDIRGMWEYHRHYGIIKSLFTKRISENKIINTLRIYYLFNIIQIEIGSFRSTFTLTIFL